MRYLPSQLDNYVTAPQKYVEEGGVDLVFVDGRERFFERSDEAPSLFQFRGAKSQFTRASVTRDYG